MNTSQDDESEIEADLSELFSESVSVGRLQVDQSDGLRVVVAEMTYRRRSSTGDGTSHSTRVTQSVVLLDDDELDLPHFALRPTIKGLGGMLLGLLGDMGDINFDDSPEFSEAYHLHGWIEPSVRALFTPAVRGHFSTHTQWSVLGRGKRLAIYQHNLVIDEDGREDFVRCSLEILSLFQDAEQQLDERPDLQRKASPADMVASAERMGGIVGGIAGPMLKRQLERIRITESEMQAFRCAHPPREIPPGMRKQVIGDNIPLMIIGAVFTIVGLVAGSLVIALSQGMHRLIGVPFLLVFPLVGFCMMFFTWRYRKQKRRTLTHGSIYRGTIRTVERTNVTVNDQARYSVSIDVSGAPIDSVETRAYGPAVQLAQELRDSGDQVDVLVDPIDSSHAVCLDLLTVFD